MKTMDSSKFTTPNFIAAYCLMWQWVLMICCVISLVSWFRFDQTIDFVTAVIFFHWTMVYHLLPKKLLRLETDRYNKVISFINTLPRLIRRKIIREIEGRNK